MRIEQLHYLIGIVNAGSYSLAAEKLHISQPSISQAITNLEEELGIKLFYRTRYGVQPTDEGLIVIRKAQEVLEKLDELKEEVNIHSSSITGNLRLAIVPSVCSTLLPKTLAIYTKKYPLVQVEIIEEGSLEVINDVRAGNAEIGVVSIPNLEYVTQSRLQFNELLETKVQACVGKNFPISNNKSISPIEIVKYPIVMLKSSYIIRQFTIDLLSDYGDLNILFTTDNTELLKKVIMEGVAIGFFSDLILKNDPYVSNGELIPLDISCNTKYSNIGWLNSKNRYFSKAAQKFIRELEEQASNVQAICPPEMK